MQHDLQQALDDALWEALWQAAEDFQWPALRVTLRSGCDKGARAFASIIPTSPALRLGGTEVRDAFRLMFAMPWAIATCFGSSSALRRLGITRGH